MDESELKAMYPLVAVVKSLRWTVASFVVVWAGVELVEPKEPDSDPDFALGPMSQWGADHVLKGAGAKMVGTEAGQALVPMDSNWLGAALEVVLGMLVSTAAELGLESVMVTMH